VRGQIGTVNTKTVSTAKIIPSGIIREACITLISKGDGAGSPGGTQLTASLFVTNGMSTWEITPTNMQLGCDLSLEIASLMTLSSELMDIESILDMTDGK